MRVKPIVKLLGMLLLSGATSSCASLVEPEYPEHFRPWDIKIFDPYLYPTNVYDVYGINEVEDWTSLVHKVHYPTTMGSMEKLTSRLDGQNYDGFGLQLGTGGGGVQVTKTTSLPDKIYMSWQSYDYSNFITVLNVTPKMKAKMLEPHENPMGWDEPCYQTSFAFGLLPDGRAKVWLYGCNIFTYVGEFKPDATKISENSHSKFGLSKKEKELGVQAEPIPWDKVDKVYYPIKRMKMETLN